MDNDKNNGELDTLTLDEQEETDEQSEESTDEAEMEDSGVDPDEIEMLRKRAEAYEAQKIRAEKAEAKLKAQLKNSKSSGASSSEIAELKEQLAQTQLLAQGIQPDEQEIVFAAAKELGISPLEAATKKYVKAELEELREQKRVKEATPSHSGRSAKEAKNVDYYIKNDILPDDLEMLRQVIAKKSGKSYKPLT